MLIFLYTAICWHLAVLSLPFYELQKTADGGGFKELVAAYGNQEIVMRGYLFVSSDGLWILSSEPNVKSCCMGAPAKAGKQVVLKGHFSQERVNQLVEVSGIFAVHADPPLFVLENAQLTTSSEQRMPWWTIGISSLVVITAALMIWLKK